MRGGRFKSNRSQVIELPPDGRYRVEYRLTRIEVSYAFGYMPTASKTVLCAASVFGFGCPDFVLNAIQKRMFGKRSASVTSLWVSMGGRGGHVVKLGVLRTCPHVHADPLLIQVAQPPIEGLWVSRKTYPWVRLRGFDTSTPETFAKHRVLAVWMFKRMFNVAVFRLLALATQKRLGFMYWNGTPLGVE